MSDKDLEVRIGRLRLNPGDILVVKLASNMSMAQVRELTVTLKQFIPENRAMFIQDGMELQVLTPVVGALENEKETVSQSG